MNINIQKMQKTERPISVCFIAPKAYPIFHPEIKEVFGGSEVDLYFLALELGKDKHYESSFITADYGQKKFERIQNINVIKSLDFKQNKLTGMFRIWRAMLKANADIYILKTISPGVPLVAFFCWLYRRAFVYRTASEHECNGEYTKKHPLLGLIFKYSIKTAKLVLTQNGTDQKNLKQSTGVSSVFLRNGHYIREIQEENRDIILWIGRSIPDKRPDLFIKLAKQIPSEKFVMICQCATGDNNYQQLMGEAKKVQNLEFIEHVPFCEVDKYFARAKLFVCTSEREGFPNTYIQACLNAVPILSLNVNPDIIFDTYNCGLCSNGDWHKFHKSLEFILEKERYIELGKNARRYAEENHDIEKIAHEYKKLFVKITDGTL